jgi:hypothetical protein
LRLQGDSKDNKYSIVSPNNSKENAGTCDIIDERSSTEEISWITVF